MHVAICCITYQRPIGLRRLLAGLNALEFSLNPTPKITVVVVDNDRSQPMRPAVDHLRPGFRWQLVYDVEPVKGFASARNRSLDRAPADADYIAMIDDDEVPTKTWLDELLDVRRRYDADIVQGPVQPAFETDPPAWLVKSGLLELGPYQDGAPLGFGYCGNSLMRAAAIREAELRFESSFNLTGGEDQRFFGRALKRGMRIVTSERAVVREAVPRERMTLRYLLKRRFRMGNTLAKIDRLEGGPSRMISRTIKGAGRIGVGLVQPATLPTRGLAGPVAGLCNLAWGTGSLVGLIGIAYREYGPPAASRAAPVEGGPRLAPTAPPRGAMQ